MSKRYLLVKAEGEGPKTCAFFSSEAGCRNGSSCKFWHGDQPTAGSTTATRVHQASDGTTTTTPPLQSSIAEGDKSEAGDERSASKKARKQARKVKDNRKCEAAAQQLATAPTGDVSIHPYSPVSPPPPLLNGHRERTVPTGAVAPAAPPTTIVESDVAAAAAAAAKKVLLLTQAKKEAARQEKAAQEAAAVAAQASAAVAVAEAAVAAELETERVEQKKKKRKKKDKDAVAERAGVVAMEPIGGTTSVAIPVTAVPNDGLTASVHNADPDQIANNTRVVPRGGGKSTKQLCSFFNKKKGCRSGALCAFLHEGIERNGRKMPPSKKAPVANGTPVAKTSKITPDNPAFVAANPSLAVSSTTPTVRASEAVNTRLTRKRGRSETPSEGQAIPGPSGGLLDGLPISPFPTTAETAASTEKDNIRVVCQGGLEDERAAKPQEVPHTRADCWQELVERTRAHPKYADHYTFKADATWVKASPCGDACDSLPQVVAVDCEMCISKDPVTKECNSGELLRMSIVRGEDGKKLIDTLVRPANPVIDWVTKIHGVGSQQMTGVQFTLRHAQAAMRRICCERTVIIGHALFNDLKALKMTHSRIVDTSLIYEGEDMKFSTPSLKDVVKTTLGKDIQSGSHDSVTDAQCTLDVARFALERRGAPLPQVARTKRNSRRSASRRTRDTKDEQNSSALLVHRLPRGTTAQQLLRVMQKKTRTAAVNAQPVVFNGTTGKSLVIYESIAQADKAFNTISSTAVEDASGRLQKKIFTSNDRKKHISVRHPLIMCDGGGLQSMSSSETGSSLDSEAE